MREDIYNCTPSQFVEEDEIDLKELFTTIKKHKLKLFFTSLFITSLAVLYAIITPNSYTSKSILTPKEQEKPSLGAGAAALASMAGINLGGGGGLDVASMFKNLLEDYSFNKMVIQKYNLTKRLDDKEMSKNFVYVLNGEDMARDLKNFLSFKEKKKNKSKEEIIFDAYDKKLKKMISVSSDKESGAITISATSKDRFLAKDLVDIYLKEMSDYMRKLDLKEINEQENYYKDELKRAESIEVKQNLATLLSNLTNKKVLSQAGEFYMIKQITKPEVAFVKDKSKPKRALIVIVAFITSLILGIFMIFFKEFLDGDKEEEIEEDKKIKKDSSRDSEISF